MIKVKPRPTEKLITTLKRFRKLCEREGIVRDMRRRMHYEKPSDQKRRERQRSIRRIQKEQEEAASGNS